MMRLQPETSQEEEAVGHDMTGDAHEKAIADVQNLLESQSINIR